MPLRCILLAVCFACLALAADDIASVAQDPHLLAAYVNAHPQVDLAPLRIALGVNDSEVFLPPCEEAGECHAEVTEVPGTKPAQAILWVSHKTSGFAFWMHYRKDAAGTWRFLTAVDVNVKYFVPEHRRTTVFGRPFFITVEQGMSGTGLSTKVECWYDLTLPLSRPVFTFTSEANHTGWPILLAHMIKATATPVKHGSVERIRVDYTVEFQVEPEDNTRPPLELGGGRATAYYVRLKSGDFRFSVSTAPKADFDSVFEIRRDDQWMTNEQFLKFDIVSLRRIASVPRSPEGEWLASFLKQCRDTPEKAELLKLLQR